jgi:hypothetical protein
MLCRGRSWSLLGEGMGRWSEFDCRAAVVLHVGPEGGASLGHTYRYFTAFLLFILIPSARQ